MPKRPLTKKMKRIRKRLMDLGMQVQLRVHRADDDAAHSTEIKLKTAALEELATFRLPAMATHEEIDQLIAEVRTVAKLGLATIGLKFSRRTA